MPSHASSAVTTLQFLGESKDVTPRMGWDELKARDVLITVEKSQGLKKGEKVKVLRTIGVLDARCEPLRRMIEEPVYGANAHNGVADG